MAIGLRRTGVALLVALGLPSILAAQTPLSDAQYLALGHKLTEWFYAAEADSLLAYLSPETRDGAGGIDGINQAVTEFIGRAGVEEELLEEKMTKRRGRPQYWREARFSEAPEPIVFRWVFDDKGLVVGVGMGPKGSTPAPD